MTISFGSQSTNPAADFGQGFFTIYDLTTGTVAANFAGFPASQTSVNLPAGTFVSGNQYYDELIFDDGFNNPLGGSPPAYARWDLRTLSLFSVPVPEPTSWALMLTGIGAAGWLRRRRISA